MNTKKILTGLLFSVMGFLFLISLNPTETYAYTYPNNTTSKTGDILLSRETNCKTECKGLSGHAAIVVDNTYFVHISGPGANPTKEKISSWFDSRYGKKTKVVRATKNYNGSAQKAANWANNYVKEYSKATYSIATSTESFDKTYCSKIVWQAFYYGSGGYPIIAKQYAGLIHPYDFSTAASGGRYAKLEEVYNKSW